MNENNRFWKSVMVVLAFTVVLWGIHFLQHFGILHLELFVNTPRQLQGLTGILFSPFIHGDYESPISNHLASNSLPFMVLLLVMLNVYPRVTWIVYPFVHIGSGLLVWTFGPANTHHVGISGVIYGLAFFLLTSGVFRKNRTALVVAILVTLVYLGSMISGLIPQEGISTQSHIYGALCGTLIAFILRRVDLPPPAAEEIDPDEEEKHFFDEVNATPPAVTPPSNPDPGAEN